MFWITLTALGVYLLLHFALGAIYLLIMNLRASAPSSRRLVQG